MMKQLAWRLVCLCGVAGTIPDANAVATTLGTIMPVGDSNTGFPSDGLSDGVHPNDAGYAWMADRLGTAIEALAVPEPNSLAILGIGLLSALSFLGIQRNRISHRRPS